MSTFTQRILWRAVPVGLATGLIGYGLRRFYLTAVEMFTSVTVEENPDSQLQGPVIFGLVGFVVAAAVECVRKNKRTEGQPQSQAPVAAP